MYIYSQKVTPHQHVMDWLYIIYMGREGLIMKDDTGFGDGSRKYYATFSNIIEA